MVPSRFHDNVVTYSVGTVLAMGVVDTMNPPNKKMQLTIAKAARLATPSLASFAIAADL